MALIGEQLDVLSAVVGFSLVLPGQMHIATWRRCNSQK